MANDEHVPLFSVKHLNRRTFLQSASSVGLTLFLSGCGGPDPVLGPSGLNPNNPNNPNPNPAPLPDPGADAGAGGGVALAGQVRLEDFGGGSFFIQTANLEQAQVGQDGSFTTMVSADGAQLILLTEPPPQARGSQGFVTGVLRGLGLSLPGLNQLLTIGAESTAVALVFMTIGIVTIDPAEAIARVNRIRALASFAALVEHLRARLAREGLAALGPSQEYQRLRQAVVDEMVANSNRLSPAEFTELLPKGLIKAEVDKNANDPRGTVVGFENHAFRWVSVIRQECDEAGNELFPPVGPQLLGATQPIELKNLLGGANGASWGSLLTLSVASPGGARDVVDLASRASVRQLKYWTYGPGLDRKNAQAKLPPSIKLADFTNVAHAVTGFYYFLLPIIDLIAGGVAGLKLLAHQVQQIVDAVLARFSLDVNFTSLNTAQDTNDKGNIATAFIDLIVAVVAAVVTLGLSAVAGGLLTGPAATAFTVLGGLLAVAGMGLALFNLVVAVGQLLRLPALAEISVKVAPRQKFLKRLGAEGEVLVYDLNQFGQVAIGRDGGVFLDSQDADPVQLLNVPGDALINAAGICVYQAADRQSHARVRGADGTTVEFVPPTGAQTAFAQGLAALSPTGIVFCKATRADGKNDLYTNTDGGSQFLGTPEGLAPSSFVDVMRHAERNRLLGNADAGSQPPTSEFAGMGNSGKLAQWSFDSRSWASQLFGPSPTFLPPSTVRYVDATPESALVFKQWVTYANPKPPGADWATFIFFLDTGEATTHQEAMIEGVNARTVFSGSDSPSSPGRICTAVALNEDGEVLGTVTEGGNSRLVLFTPGGEQDLVGLFPGGAPPGTWTPLQMVGKYIVLRHTDPVTTATSIYLFYRGE